MCGRPPRVLSHHKSFLFFFCFVNFGVDIIPLGGYTEKVSKHKEYMDQKQTFFIRGMHCNACVLLTESEIGEMSNVTFVKADLKKGLVEVSGEFGEKTREEIATELSGVLRERGYSISSEKIGVKKKWSDFKIVIPIVCGFVVLFWILQKMNLVQVVSSEQVTYGTAFFIGVIASLSSCMAVVGGLLLSLSATFAKEGDTIRPQLMFHGGRIVSFFFFGGVIGLLGSAFTLSSFTSSVLSILLGVVMLFLGIHLLDVFSWTKRFQLAMPNFIARHAHTVLKWNHTATPIFAGIATFFLPCGFTQSMQLYTLSTGSFLNGAFTMTAFALGTFPVLALISFSSISIKDGPASGIFFKTAGFLVILFAVFNIINGLVVAGIIPPVFNF